MPTPINAHRALVLATLLLTVGLAGCATDDNGGTPYASFEEARDANTPGPFSPDTGESQLNTMSEDEASNIQLKVLVPETNEELSTGQQDVWILIYDDAEDEPITDASVSIQAWMPHMGHGASPEENPTHVNDGMYNGLVTWSMDGEWEMRLDITIGNDVLYYAPTMWVGQQAE